MFRFIDSKRDDFREIRRKVKTNGRYVIRKNLSNRMYFSESDKILFCLAGEEDRKFVVTGLALNLEADNPSFDALLTLKT